MRNLIDRADFTFFLLMVLLFLPLLVTAEDVCFANAEEQTKPEFLISNLLLTVNWFETEEELIEAVNALGYETDESLEVSECEIHVEQDIGWCELWLVVPKTVVGGQYMDSLGHEAFHGFAGDFHE